MHKCFHVVKRPISLIEVLIAMMLTVAILMTLTFFYRQITEIGFEMDRVQARNFTRRYMETRLTQILPRTVGVSDDEKDFVFFSVKDDGVTKPGSENLIFSFDNAISLDKSHAAHVLGRLYVDKNGNLMLAYWPSPKRWGSGGEMPAIKKELLLEGVESLSFEFYIAPAKKEKEPIDPNQKVNQGNAQKKESKPKRSGNMADYKGKLDEEEQKDVEPEPEPKGDWRKQAWLQDYNQLPVMVKLIVKMEKEDKPLEFIYPLANTKSHIVYE